MNLYVNGYVPSYSTVYPSFLTFSKGETLKEFWISIGKLSRGVNGSILITLSGTNLISYSMHSRKINFLVSSPTTAAPLMFQRSDLLFGNSWIAFWLTMNVPCTVYYGLFGPGTNDRDKGFSVIKNKKVPYDYFEEEYWMGESINDITNFNYSMNLTGLTPYKDYYLQVYVEDLNGILCETPILSNISTNS